MAATHLELLVEELSMEAFLRAFLPRMLPADRTFEVHPFQGKSDLLGKLQSRLAGYAAWIPEDWCIVVVVDRDGEDCRTLKKQLEQIAAPAKLATRSRSRTRMQLINRIAIEELEAWYFGEWSSVRSAYPRVAAGIPNQAAFRDPDAIQGGTWESFERTLQRYGYFKGGLEKIDCARRIGSTIDPSRSRSHSFKAFCDAIADAVT